MADPAAPSAPAVLPFGSWPTPITSELVVRAAVGFGGVVLDGGDVWWSEQRPEEGGRTQLVCRRSDGTTLEVLPPGWNARTAAHEYGGGAWWVRSGTAWFASWVDQRLYRVEPGGEPVAVTPEPAAPRADRWADGEVSPDGRSMLCVREHHPIGGGPADVVNDVVRFDLGAGASVPARSPGPARRLVPARPPLGRRSSSTVRTSCPIPAGAPTARRSAGWSGTTRTCRGTAPVSWSRRRTAAERCSSPAVPTSRCSSPAGTTTARSGSSPTAAAGGTSTAGRRTARSSRWS